MEIDFEIDDDLDIAEKSTLIATAIFQKFDANKNKTLDREEVNNFFTALLKMGGVHGYSEKAVQMSERWFEIIDQNSDG